MCRNLLCLLSKAVISPPLSSCARAGLGYLIGLWLEIAAFSRDPGLLLRAPRLCCIKDDNDASQKPSTGPSVPHEPARWATSVKTSSHSFCVWAFHQELSVDVLMDLMCLSTCVLQSVPSVHPWVFPLDLCRFPACSPAHECGNPPVQEQAALWRRRCQLALRWWRCGGTRPRGCSCQLCPEFQLLWVHPGLGGCIPMGVTTSDS